MLKVKFNGVDVELLKGEYINGRFAVIIVVPNTKEKLTTLTVNIPEAMFFGETLGDSNCYEALINHIDGFDYISLLNWLDEINITDPEAIVGEIKSGFNSYKGVKFKNDVVKQMRRIDEVF